MSGLSSVLSSALSALSLTPTSPSEQPPLAPAASDIASTSSSDPQSPPLPTATPEGFTYACPLSSLPVHSRRCLSVSNRALLLFRLPSRPPPSSSSSPVRNFIPSDSSSVWAIDAICYHMGGPLIEGDIEELLGTPHVVCPWHHYRISIETGEGAYQVVKGQWKSKGRRQRTHEVRVEGGNVYVRVGSSAEGKVESDVYGDRPISQEDVDVLEKKRKMGGEYKSKGPSGLNRGSTP